MKKEFPGYYEPTDKDFKNIWDTCDFIFDANVLLNLYRYSEETRQALISILESVKDRIWIPYQAALEYHRNRIKVIQKQKNEYTNVKTILSNYLNKTKIDLEKVYKNGRHPQINCDDFIDKLSKYFEEYKNEIDKLEDKHPDFIINDPVKNKLTRLFEDRVCDPLKTEDEHLKLIFLTGVTKFAKVSVFSGLNNLVDLTMTDTFSGMMGYTRDELTHNFKDEITELATNLVEKTRNALPPNKKEGFRADEKSEAKEIGRCKKNGK